MKTSNVSKLNVRRFKGRITWFNSKDEWIDQRKVIQGIRRSDEEIAFDCDYSEPGSAYTYTVTIRRTARCSFEGQFTGGRSEEKNTGRVVAREYANSFGFVLVGKWTESNSTDDWFAEMIYDAAAQAAQTQQRQPSDKRP